MLKIRLARGGSAHRPYYRIVVADSKFARDGRFIEKIGAYNPLLGKEDPKRIQIDLEKAGEWLKKGAQPTDRVARFLGAAGLIKWEHGNNPEAAVPGEKAKTRATEKSEKEEARKVAASAPKEEAPAEAPAEAAAE